VIRTTSTAALGALLSAAVAAGCKDAPPPPPAPPPVAAASATAGGAGDSPLAIAKNLALAAPGGTASLDKEIETLQRSAQNGGPRTEPWVLLGRAWVRKARAASDPGFYLNAKACADVALDISPDDPLAKNLVGLVLLNDHKFNDARDLAEQMLRKRPNDLMALGTLGDALVELGRYPEAIKAVGRMMDEKPNLPSYIRTSYLQWLQGDINDALESVRLATDAGRDPRDPEPRSWALVQAAMIFWHQGDYPGADKGFDVAMEGVPDYPPALVGKGRIALGKGDGAAAVGFLAKAYQQNPLVETTWLLGDAKEMAGDQAGAAEAYAAVVKHGRQTDGRTLALFYATKDRDHEEAVRLAEAERPIRDDIYTEDTLAWALYRAGKLPEARAASDKAVALGTKDARLLYHAGAIRMASGDKEGGAKLVKEALRLNPKFDVTGAAEANRLVGGG
jgi:tetratricopeptide (TPR) repeat protein